LYLQYTSHTLKTKEELQCPAPTKGGYNY